MDGLAAVLQVWNYAGPRQLARLAVHGLLDVGRAVLGRAPHTIPLVGPPGALGAMTTADSEPGYTAIAGPSWVNALSARTALTMPMNRPVTRAKRLRMPVMLVVANYDEIAPPPAMDRVAKRVRGRVEVLRLDVGHFDIYVGDPFEQVREAPRRSSSDRSDQQLISCQIDEDSVFRECQSRSISWQVSYRE